MGKACERSIVTRCTWWRRSGGWRCRGWILEVCQNSMHGQLKPTSRYLHGIITLMQYDWFTIILYTRPIKKSGLNEKYIHFVCSTIFFLFVVKQSVGHTCQAVEVVLVLVAHAIPVREVISVPLNFDVTLLVQRNNDDSNLKKPRKTSQTSPQPKRSGCQHFD